MRHFPIFLDLREKCVVVSGAGETAVAKLRLILKTEARVCVYGSEPDAQTLRWAGAGALTLHPRAIAADEAAGATLFYAANDDAAEDARAAAIGHAAGALVTIVDNLEDSAFITPAIVDRDPVVVAIGTEGAAPVLARRIKAETEERLSIHLGALTRIGRRFRPQAKALPHGRPRRRFWARFYDETGPRAYLAGGEQGSRAALEALLSETLQERAQPGRVAIISAPDDPDYLTIKARRLLDEADTVLHDAAVAPAILELVRREAKRLIFGKDAMDIAAEAAGGAHVVRLVAGEAAMTAIAADLPTLFATGVAVEVLPGVTGVAAASNTPQYAVGA